MIKTIIVKSESYTRKILFFDELDLTQFKTNVIPLFGPNGVGKSTLLKSILKSSRNEFDELRVITKPGNKTMCYAYINSEDNFKYGRPKTYAMAYDIGFMKSTWDARSISEGQSIIYSLMDLLDEMDKTKPEEGIDISILLDEIDSGLSIDNVDMIMRKIKRIIKHRPDVQFIFSFNQPRVLKWFPQVLSMYDGTMIELHTEDDMMDEIKKHKKVFDRIRKRKGRPKVFE